MIVLFKIIRLSIFKTLLRPLNIVFIFLPIFLYDNISFIKSRYFWGAWSVVSLILFFLQINFLTRYKITGIISIAKDKFEIKQEKGTLLTFLPSDKLNIYLNYKGYKGESEKYLNPMFMSISPKEGIGRLEIIKDNVKFRYDFLAEEDSYKRLVEILNLYKQTGNDVDLRKD